ncbi:MAG: single-stranded DNA-binding protein [Planctomycetes bacterium]|nr:single-stranded DNA-binding protein [Planctomycetota bacterium]
MSFSANRVIIAGNLVRDPEPRPVGSDRNVAHFTVAINNRYKSADGELKETAVFMDCEAWGKQAELVCTYLKKGSCAYFEGQLKQDNWQDKDGQRRSRIKVRIDVVRFVGNQRQGGDEGEGEGEGEQTASSAPPATAANPAAMPARPGPSRARATAHSLAAGCDTEPPF